MEAKKLAAANVLVKEKVDDETAACRMEICQKCEMLNEKITCMVCDCLMELKTKSKINRSPQRPFGEITHCPLGKWGDIDIANYYRAEDSKEPL